MVIAASPSNPQLDTLVASIVDRVRPELVLLFGSRATGQARDDSDYDLMLVVHDGEDAEASREIADEVRQRLNLPVDILTCTASDYLRRQHDPGFMEWLVAREGRLLYTRGTVPQRSPSSKRVRERPSEGIDLWIERAEGDWRAARISLKSADPPWATVCFLAHACVEKLLKAVIVGQGTFPPRTHRLTELIALAPAALHDDTGFIAACAVLEKLYPKSRYVPHPLPTPGEARRAVEAARKARERLLQQLKQQRPSP